MESIIASDNDFDVVLIDTAGRMQDNEPLMRALAKVPILTYFPTPYLSIDALW
jgi:signal recognition particle GTPase